MLDRLEARAWRRHAPPPRLSVPAWCDANRRLGRGESPVPGPWRTSRTPYLAEPLDCLADPSVETIVLMLSSQIGKNGAITQRPSLRDSANDPGPSMFVMPTLELAGSFSTDRLTPALRNCPPLAASAPRSRSTGDAILAQARQRVSAHVCAEPTVPASLASRPVRFLSAATRSITGRQRRRRAIRLASPFSERPPFVAAKSLLASTPTIKGASRIEDWYARSDQRELWPPCPRCGGRFVVRWKHVVWSTGEPDSAHIECPLCRGRIEDSERGGDVRCCAVASRQPRRQSDQRVSSVGESSSPWVRLSELGNRLFWRRRNNPTLQTFINLKLGESWEVPSEKVESAGLLLRRERYAAEVPAGAEILTIGIDTQDDRLEALVVGWGHGEESWVISRESYSGDPELPDVWREMDESFLREWPREGGGNARIVAGLVDCLGHRTSAVYRAVIPRQSRRLFASVGRDGGESGQLVSPAKAVRTSEGTVLRRVVDASQAKALIYSRLRIETPGPGFVHFPMTVGDGFFTELTAEHLIAGRNKYGVPSKRWAMRPGHERNESLDCFGLALAALRTVAPTPARFRELAARLAGRR